MKKSVKVRLVCSPISCPPDQRQTVVGLGLRRLHQERILKDSASVRGMVHKVCHLVTLEEQDAQHTKTKVRK